MEPTWSGHAWINKLRLEITESTYLTHTVGDISLADYIGVQPTKHATYLPHTAGRYSVKRFRKA
ncbi:hypothetical protein FCM35_KLT02978 [Carex littledalei]|uniref:Uncharacterized protein n=1 Tax=Carex littledalei TaxID=544730 RepID=A0A833VAY2_9POAL|nr:hypothetical protein FCM35_KLT02978 [Carex littledalei]